MSTAQTSVQLSGSQLRRIQRTSGAAQDHVLALADIILRELSSPLRADEVAEVRLTFDRRHQDDVDVPFPGPGTVVILGPDPGDGGPNPCVAIYRDPPGVCEPCPPE